MGSESRSTSVPGTSTNVPRWSGLRLLTSTRTGGGTFTAELDAMLMIATLRTKNTPTQMAFTFDRKYLLVGHDNSQMASMFDLDSFEEQMPIVFPFGHYPK